jgi:hypothetical protein
MFPPNRKNLSRSQKPNGINEFHPQIVTIYYHMLEFLNCSPIYLFFYSHFIPLVFIIHHHLNSNIDSLFIHFLD